MISEQELQILIQERTNTGTSWTRNEQFDKDGYLKVENLWDPKELYRPVPEERGQRNYWGKKLDQYNDIGLETQVNGSFATYWHPQYRMIHSQIRKKIETIIGRELYNTYYYDRFYFSGQKLSRHCDRPACEISVSVHISSNIKKPWPLWIKTPDTFTDKTKNVIDVEGENRSVILKPGDGMIYKGCERPHWREELPVKKKKKEVYYHQVFFHYVLADGYRAQCANDMAS